MNIYTYWEGERPAYIDMCKRSLKKYAGDLKLVELDHYDKYNDLAINHKVDLLKGTLIRDNGGFWIDADMIVLKDLTPLMRLLDKVDFIGMPGFFGGKAGAPILTDWVRSMENIIKRDVTFSSLIRPLLEHPLYKPYKHLTHEMITPIWHTGDEFWNFFSDTAKLEDFITENTYIVTLYNSQFSEEFKKMSEEEILSKNWLISKMFKCV